MQQKGCLAGEKGQVVQQGRSPERHGSKLARTPRVLDRATDGSTANLLRRYLMCERLLYRAHETLVSIIITKGWAKP